MTLPMHKQTGVMIRHLTPRSENDSTHAVVSTRLPADLPQNLALQMRRGRRHGRRLRPGI